MSIFQVPGNSYEAVAIISVTDGHILSGKSKLCKDSLGITNSSSSDTSNLLKIYPCRIWMPPVSCPPAPLPPGRPLEYFPTHEALEKNPDWQWEVRFGLWREMVTGIMWCR